MEYIATIPKLFTRKWWLPTIIVILGVYGLIRLGYWQLDRLEQRRAFNDHVAERWRLDPYDVTTDSIPSDLSELEYRRVEAKGTFDYDNQIVLVSQTRNDAPGSIVFTPLVLEDGRAILVARGWLPSGDDDPERWSQYNEPTDKATDEPIIGLIQESQLLPNGNKPTVPDSPQTRWFQINIDAIQPQMPYELLPVFILQLPEEGRSYTQLPIREEPIVLDEGNHFSYAIQWFCFAMVLGVGYLFLVHSQELRDQRIAGTLEGGASQDTGAEADGPYPVQSNNAL